MTSLGTAHLREDIARSSKEMLAQQKCPLVFSRHQRDMANLPTFS